MKNFLKFIWVIPLISGILFLNFSQEKKLRPNILFILLDDAGKDMSAYGNSWIQTPAFDQIAREGLLFEKAYTPNAKCAPSRSCLLTGRNPWQLEAAMNHVIYFPDKFKTYAETLSENGYFTGYTGKGYAPGKALNKDGSKRDLLVKKWDAKTLVPPAKFISNNDYAANFEEFVNDAQGESWCFWLGFTEPHRPYEFGAGIRHKKLTDIKSVPAYWPDTDTVRTDMLDYAYEIEYADSQVAKILLILREKGELENTLIIYTSDHGMPFPRVKGNEYEQANHVPMAIRWGNGIRNTGRKIKDYVNFIDLAPTLLEVAGIKFKKSGMARISGKSWLNIFKSDQSENIEKDRDFMLVAQERHDFGRPNDEGYPVRGLHQENYLLLKNYKTDRWPACNPETGYLNCDGGATKSYILNQRRNGQNTYFWDLCFGKRPDYEFYDLSNDPFCIENLAEKQELEPLIKKMENKMEGILLSQGDWRMLGKGDDYDKIPGAEVNGFYERYMNGEKIPTPWVNNTDYETKALD